MYRDQYRVTLTNSDGEVLDTWTVTQPADVPHISDVWDTIKVHEKWVEAGCPTAPAVLGTNTKLFVGDREIKSVADLLPKPPEPGLHPIGDCRDCNTPVLEGDDYLTFEDAPYYAHERCHRLPDPGKVQFYKTVAEYFCDLFQQYSVEPIPIDRQLKETRVGWSDLTFKWPTLNVDDRVALQPHINRAMRRRKLSFK
jgi:hypothetical protein